MSLESLFRQIGILSDQDLTEELLNAVEKLSPESDNFQAILAFQKLQRTVKLSAPVASHGISNFYKRIDEDAKSFQKSMFGLNELVITFVYFRSFSLKFNIIFNIFRQTMNED